MCVYSITTKATYYTTLYGTSRASTRDFYPHHLAAISHAAQAGG